MMSKTVCLHVEVPEVLYEVMQEFIEHRPDWSRERLLCAALSLFLLQNGASNRQTSRLYLNSIFDRPAEAA